MATQQQAIADGYGFDWRDQWVAEEHDALNRPLFEGGDPSETPYFSALGDMIREALSRGILKDGCGILDVGCGAGWQRVHLGREGLMDGLAYTGIDVSAHMVSLARRNVNAMCPPRKRPYSDTECEADAFDTADSMEYETNRPCCLVMACGVIELFGDWEAFVRRLASFGPGGILLHKVFFDKKKTHREVVWSYGEKKEFRTFILRDDLDRLAGELGYTAARTIKLDPGYPNYSVLLERRQT